MERKSMVSSSTIQAMLASALLAVGGYLTGTVDQGTLISTLVMSALGIVQRLRTERGIKLPGKE